MSTKIQVGDMVRFDRSFYTHWGVCVDDLKGEIVHVGPENDTHELDSLRVIYDSNMRVIVKKDRICAIAEGCKYYADNYLDKNWDPFPKQDIRNFALEQVKKCSWTYNLWLRNCESFAIWLRYREDYVGDQSRNATIGVGITAGLLALGAAALGAYSLSQADKDEEEKRKRKSLKQ